MEPRGSFPHLQKPSTCPFPEPDQSNPCPTSHFLMITFNIILPYTHHRSSKWSLSHRLRYQNPVRTCPIPIYDTWPTLFQSSCYDRPNIWCWSLSSPVCSFLHSPVTSSLLGLNILSTPFPNTLSLRSSLDVKDQVWNPYKQQEIL
jgi:hypothetical protein